MFLTPSPHVHFTDPSSPPDASPSFVLPPNSSSRHVVYNFITPYHVTTNVPAFSKDLKIIANDTRLEYRCCNRVIAELCYKLEGDVFSIHAQPDISQRTDLDLWDRLKPLATCFVARIFQKPWDFKFISSELVPVDLGDGLTIEVSQQDAHETGAFLRRSSLSPTRRVTALRRVQSAAAVEANKRIDFLRWLEYFTARYLNVKTGENPYDIVSRAGYEDMPEVVKSVHGTFEPYVPTLFGLAIDWCNKVGISFGGRRGLWTPTVETARYTGSRNSTSDEVLTRDIEMGQFALPDMQASDTENASDNEAVAGKLLPRLQQTARWVLGRSAHQTSLQEPALGGICEPDDVDNNTSVEESPETMRKDPSSDASTPSNISKRALEVQCSPPGTAVSETRVQIADISDGAKSMGAPVSPMVSPRSPRYGRMDTEISLSSGHLSLDPAGGLCESEGMSMPGFAGHHVMRMSYEHRSSSGSIINANDRTMIHVGKDVFTLITGVIVLIIAIATCAFDPAHERNWFKQMEKGIFVLLTLGVPLILLMRSHLTDSLTVILPRVKRPVESLEDFRNMNSGLQEDRFIRQLQRAILVDKEIAKLFKFKNVCYKLDRTEGSLEMPETCSYDRHFKQVWLFGDELAFNKLTGCAFRYREVDGTLIIEREAVRDDGIIVHTRRKSRQYRIGMDVRQFEDNAGEEGSRRRR